MKKLVLLLFLFLSISINAQINQNVTPYQLCSDPNLPGFANFDLAIKVPEILQGLNPTENNVSFYQTLTDSQTGTNALLTPTSYISPYNPFTIYVRVVNNQTGELGGITSFQCEALPAPTANPADLEFCDMMELALYNLSDADSQITGGVSGSIVSYHETLNDALTGGTVIPPGGYIPLINPGNQTLYARVSNPSTGCFNTTTLTLHTHNCTPCQTPTLVVNSSVTYNNALISWTDSGAATIWQIISLSAGSPAPTISSTGMYTPVNPYVLGDLVPNTNYDVYVRSICYNGLSDWSEPTTVTTPTAPPVCGGNFIDQGGINANYPNNSNYTTTICPTTPGDSVSVTFTSFNTEVNQDALYVYDGANITPSALIASSNAEGNVPGGLAGGYWGNTIPGPFISSSANGCLTFNFRSDANNTLEGWVANVSCITVPCEPPTTITVSNLTGTSVTINWNNPSNGNSREVLILPQDSPPPTFDSFGNVTQANPYVVTGLSPDVCYTVYVRTICALYSEWSAPVDFCMFNCENNADCAESLNLIAFLDSNNNGIKDSGEQNFTYGNFVYQVNDSLVNQYGTSNNGYYYIFDSNPTNSYDIQFDVNTDLTSYYTSAVTHNNITLPSGSGGNTLYFPVVNILPHVDARVSLINSGQPRPGFTYTVSILYQNYGSQTISNGTLNFTKDPNLTITNVSEAGVLSTANGFSFDFTNIAPFESRSLYVTFLVPTIPTVALGDLVTNTTSIQISNDIDLSNNNTSLTQAIVGSYDPNDMTESHGGKIVHSTFTASDYLYYTIRFENTGTASAEFIRVEDILDSQLDENTFEMISASHSVNTKRNGNQLTWHFYNVDLPPTITNPAASHGYVYFKIKPKSGYAVGAIIPNTASIYFDYNPAIITNTFTTQFVQALSNSTFNSTTISLHPNPTSTNFVVNTTGIVKISEISIYDVTGKKIFTMNENKLDRIAIDVSFFAKGIYLVEMTSEDHQKLTKKLIIQ